MIEIMGRPAPKGSKKAHPNAALRAKGVIIPSNTKNLPAWERACKKAMPELAEALQKRSLDLTGRKGVAYRATYYFVQAKSNKDCAPIIAPDLDKLNRCLFDVITKSGLIDDDCRITSQTTRKRWSETGYDYARVSLELDCI